MTTLRAVIRPLGVPGDLGWVVQAHGEVYAAEFGWDATFEALVARIVADFANTPEPDRLRTAAWIAEVDGRRAGSVFCVDGGDGRAQLRILLVTPNARGLGLGARLVDECVAFARTAGYNGIWLWTNDPLASARRIYLSRGFELVSQAARPNFGADLVEQLYALPFALGGAASL